METLLKTGILILLSILSGILGRMGGAEGYNTKYRDAGCSLIAVISLWVIFTFQLSLWWAYLLVFGLHWLFLSTYWDWLFKFDNFWFSGFCVGLCLLIYPTTWYLVLIRSVILACIWGSLNRYLPSKVLIWRRDVAEEFLRYFSIIATLPILLI